MGGAQHENSVDRKYMDVSAVKVYDVVLSRSMTIKTNTKIIAKLRISIASPARLFFQFALHPDTLFQLCCLNFDRVASESVFQPSHPDAVHSKSMSSRRQKRLFLSAFA